MFQLLKSPEWFARSLYQLCALQKPIWRCPTLSLQHCAVCSLPMTSLSGYLRTIQPRKPDNVIVISFLVTTVGCSFDDTHVSHTSHSLDAKGGPPHAQDRLADPKSGKGCLQPGSQGSGELA